MDLDLILHTNSILAASSVELNEMKPNILLTLGFVGGADVLAFAGRRENPALCTSVKGDASL